MQIRFFLLTLIDLPNFLNIDLSLNVHKFESTGVHFFVVGFFVGLNVGPAGFTEGRRADVGFKVGRPLSVGFKVGRPLGVGFKIGAEVGAAIAQGMALSCTQAQLNDPCDLSKTST